MTIDIANLPIDSETECNFSEMPSMIQDRVNLHLREQEEPTLCVVLRKEFKFGDEFTWDFLVQVLTPHRAIKIAGFMYKDKSKGLGFSGHDNVSMVLSEFVGFTERDDTVDRLKYKLVLHTRADDMTFYFFSNEKLKKFARTILGLSKDY